MGVENLLFEYNFSSCFSIPAKRGGEGEVNLKKNRDSFRMLNFG